MPHHWASPACSHMNPDYEDHCIYNELCSATNHGACLLPRLSSRRGRSGLKFGIRHAFGVHFFALEPQSYQTVRLGSSTAYSSIRFLNQPQNRGLLLTRCIQCPDAGIA